MSQGSILANELRPYVTSGNDVPVERATIPADLLLRILHALEEEWHEGYAEGREDAAEECADDSRRSHGACAVVVAALKAVISYKNPWFWIVLLGSATAFLLVFSVVIEWPL